MGQRVSKTAARLGGEMEDTPGFTLVVASAAIAMAVFVNIGKEEENEA